MFGHYRCEYKRFNESTDITLLKGDCKVQSSKSRFSTANSVNSVDPVAQVQFSEMKVHSEDKFQNPLLAYLIFGNTCGDPDLASSGAPLARASVAPYIRIFGYLSIRKRYW